MTPYSRTTRNYLLAFAALSTLTLLPRPAHAWVVSGEPGADFKAVAADGRGCVAVAGQIQDGSGGNGFYVARYSASGKLLWRAVEAGGSVSAPSQALAVAADAKGDVYAAGTLSNGASALPVVAKYSGQSGKRLWMATADARPGQGETLCVDGSGRVTVGGYVDTEDGPHAWMARLDAAQGSLRWTWSPLPGEIRSLAVDGKGDAYGTGRLVAVKLSGATGGEVWRTQQSGPGASGLGFPLMRSIAVDGSGRVLVGGALRDSLMDTRAFYAAALDAATGQFRWEQAGPAAFGGDTAVGVTCDLGGGVYAAGELSGLPALLDLNGASGKQTWIRQPWKDEPTASPVPAIAALNADKRAAYASGVSTGGSWAAASITRTGSVRWSVNLGPGRVAAQSLNAKGQLFLTGRLAVGGDPAQRAVLVGLTAATGRQLPGASR